MTKLIKILSGFISVCLILFLLAIPVLGIEGWSDLLGYDIQNITINGTHHSYGFSLVDRLPVILLVSSLLIGFFIFVFFKADQVLLQIKALGRFVYAYSVDTFYLIKKSNVKYFLFLSFGVTLYLAYCYPLTLDEPLTYYDFIKPSFWHSIALYPYPNNHVFSTLLVNIFNEIPGLDLLFRLRLPAVLISLLTWIFAYRFVRKYYGENVALFVVSVGTIVVTNMQHAYIARGYAFVIFFVVIGFYSAFNIIRNDNRQRDWVAFALSSALGAWTMPSYLYPFLSLSLLIFVYNYRSIKLQILYSALVGVLVFLMYSPILLVSGIKALTSNEFVQTIDRLTVIKSLPGFMLGVLVHMFYMPHYVVIILFLLVLSYVAWRRDKKVILLWLIFGLTPCLFLTLHAVIPFFRTFFYYGFIFIFLIGISFADLLSKVDLKKITIGLLCIHIFGIVFFFKISKNLMPEVFQSDTVIKEVLGDKKKYYLDSGISWMQMMNLKFEAERKNYQIDIEIGNASDVEQLPDFDYYLIRKKINSTSSSVESKEMMGIFHTPIVIYSK